MAFNGTLLKVGSYVFPLKYIQLESYICTPNQRQDLDSGVNNASGVLERNVYDHKRSKIEFTTPYMHLKDMQTLMSNLKAQYINSNERKVSVTYYDQENDTHKPGTFYIPDITWTIYNVDEIKKDIIYLPTRIAFIEY